MKSHKIRKLFIALNPICKSCQVLKFLAFNFGLQLMLISYYLVNQLRVFLDLETRRTAEPKANALKVEWLQRLYSIESAPVATWYEFFE